VLPKPDNSCATDTLTDAILDRVIHNAYKFELDESMRKWRMPEPSA
jgi:hypothetical protein